MNYTQFKEAAAFAMSQLSHWQIEKGLEYEGNRMPLPHDVTNTLYDGMDEWCNDNDIDPEEWQEQWDIDDVWNEGFPEDFENLSESFTEERYSSYRPLTNGQALNGIKGLATIMLDYEKYCKAALMDIVNYYKKLNIKVLSAVTGVETSENHSGFVIKLERNSVEEYLEKNTAGYDAFDDEEPVDEYMAEDFKDLTINGWQSCGKNAMFLFRTLWTVTERPHYGDMGKSYYIPEGDLEFKFDSPNTLSIYFDPGVFDYVHDILSEMMDCLSEENILACGEVKS